MTDAVLYRKQGRLAYVTLNRPDARNRLDDELNRTLWDVWRDSSEDPALDVAMLTGSGKVLCVGADLKTYIPQWENAASLKPRRHLHCGEWH